MRASLSGVSGIIILTLGGVAVTAPAKAQTLTASDILSQFNAVITGTFSSRADVEGRLVVGGNMTGGATFYINPEATASTYGAVNVYGSVSGGNYNVNSGGNVNVAGSNAGRFNLNGGGTYSNSVPGGDFTSTFAKPLTTLSSSLANMTANNVLPTVTDMNNVQITASNVNSDGYAVYKINASDLSKYASFAVNTGSAKTVVFNVAGNYTQNANFQNFTDTTVDSHVIWNFTTATSLSFQGFGGTVLAATAAVTNNSPINGDLFAASYSGNGELHDHPFAGVLPAPLPPIGSSIAGLLVLAGFGTLRMRGRMGAVVARLTGRATRG